MVKYQKYQLPRLKPIEADYYSGLYELPESGQTESSFISYTFISQDFNIQDVFDSYLEADYRSSYRSNLVKHYQYLRSLFCSREHRSTSWAIIQELEFSIRFLQGQLERSKEKELKETTKFHRNLKQIEWQAAQKIQKAFFHINQSTSKTKSSDKIHRSHPMAIELFWEQICLKKQKQK